MLVMKQGGGRSSDEGPDREYSMKVIERGCGWLAVWCRRMIHGFAFGATNPPPTSLRGIQERPQLEGYPTHQPEPCSSLHHARIVDVAFELRVFSRLLLSSKASRCHTTLSIGIWNVSCSAAIIRRNGPSRDRVTPQSCHIRNSWRTPKMRHCHRFTRRLLKCIGSASRGVISSSMGLKCTFDGSCAC
jgi:hypothetical protein